MPTYQFSCDDCSVKVNKLKGKAVCDIDNEVDGWSSSSGFYMFYLFAKMADKPINPKCPNCGGKKTHSCLYGQHNESWIRGNGIVNDKAGARRDMNKHKVINDDPYGHMRQSGEVDHLIDQCNRGGMNMEIVNKQHYALAREAKSRADKMIEDDLSEDQVAVMMLIEKLSDHEGVEFEVFSKIADPSGVLTSLMPEYVFKRKNGKFTLMAKGGLYIDNILNPD